MRRQHPPLPVKHLFVLLVCSASFIRPVAFAQSGESIHSASGQNFKARFEGIKNEIISIKSETDAALNVIDSLKETNSCLETVHKSLTTLSERLNALGTRADASSYAHRTGILVSKHVAFFDALDEFSKNSLSLVQKADGSTVVDNAQLQDVLEKIARRIAELKQQFAAQAGEEEAHLAKLSLQLVQLKRAIHSAELNSSNTKRCAPALENKSQKLIEDAKQAAAHLSLSRKLIAELQGKRAQVLGALASGLQKKVAAQLANASQQTADTLQSKINLTLAELQLRSEVERWWFKESLEQGPARGFLAGSSSKPLKAAEILQVAIATCDALIATAREQRVAAQSDVSTANSEGVSALESSLFQRREALSRWLKQAQTSLPSAAQ